MGVDYSAKLMYGVQLRGLTEEQLEELEDLDEVDVVLENAYDDAKDQTWYVGIPWHPAAPAHQGKLPLPKDSDEQWEEVISENLEAAGISDSSAKFAWHLFVQVW